MGQSVPRKPGAVGQSVPLRREEARANEGACVPDPGGRTGSEVCWGGSRPPTLSSCASRCCR